MKSRLAAIIILAGFPASAHRVDEYLQATILSLASDRIEAQLTLTPGIAVVPLVMAAIDLDSDGTLSPTEQRAYAARVLHDLILAVDGQPLKPNLTSLRFPAVNEIQDGRGSIQLDFTAQLPPGGPQRRFTLENHHQPRISAYQVNALVPRDSGLRIAAQIRNYTQSTYELGFVQNRDAPASTLLVRLFGGGRIWLIAAILLIGIRLTFVRYRSGAV